MASPDLHIVSDPDLSDQQIYYLPLAPQSRDHEERYKLCARLHITNRERGKRAIRITGIEFEVPGHGSFPMDMVPERNMEPADGRLGRNDTAVWHNGSWRPTPQDDFEYNQVYFDGPAPTRLKVHVTCSEFDEPYTQEFDLIRWGNPTGDGALLLPFLRHELDDDEYVVTSAVHNFNGDNSGTQIFAYDIRIEAQVNGQWSRNRVANPTTNTDSRIFGRPIRAMAHGEVFKVDLGFGPGRYHSTDEGYWDNDFGSERTDSHKGSIHVWVRYGDIEICYKHLRRGSVAVEEGDDVWPGRKLAEAGNSGNTGGSPHLHMECRLTSNHRLCAMTFRNTWQLEKSLVPDDNGHGQSVRMEDQGVCQQEAALRPFSTQRPPLSAGEPDLEDWAIVAEVFGGISKGGDGFTIVNGKLTRVPPRGIKGDLLKAIIEIAEAEELEPKAAAKRIDALAKELQGKLAASRRGR
jgi:hypothetical protein